MSLYKHQQEAQAFVDGYLLANYEPKQPMQFIVQARHHSIAEFGLPMAQSSQEIEREHPLECRILRQRPDIQAVTISLQSGDIRISRATAEQSAQVAEAIAQSERDWQEIELPA